MKTNVHHGRKRAAARHWEERCPAAVGLTDTPEQLRQLPTHGSHAWQEVPLPVLTWGASLQLYHRADAVSSPDRANLTLGEKTFWAVEV